MKALEIEVALVLGTPAKSSYGVTTWLGSWCTSRTVSSLAGPSEVLVSRTVTDLVAGSGIEFEDRGEHELKGIDGTWQLFAVKA